MIIAYDGNFSSGKTLSAVKYCYEQGLKGKKVISNIKLKLPQHIAFVYLPFNLLTDTIIINYDDNEKLKEIFQDSVILIDEIVNWISARKTTTNLNELMTNFLMFVGKMRTEVVYTCQIFESQVDLRLRTVTNIRTSCIRLSQDGNMLDSSQRKVKEKVWIIQRSLIDLGLFGEFETINKFDPSPYYNFYDTEEMNLFNKLIYQRGGKKDLAKW